MKLREWIKDVRRVRVRPGDVVMVETNRRITIEQAVTIQEMLSESFPDNQIVVLADFMDLKVAGP